SYCFFLSFFFSSRRRHTRFSRDWSSDVCSSDLVFPTSGLVYFYCLIPVVYFDNFIEKTVSSSKFLCNAVEKKFVSRTIVLKNYFKSARLLKADTVIWLILLRRNFSFSIRCATRSDGRFVNLLMK